MGSTTHWSYHCFAPFLSSLPSISTVQHCDYFLVHLLNTPALLSLYQSPLITLQPSTGWLLCITSCPTDHSHSKLITTSLQWAHGSGRQSSYNVPSTFQTSVYIGINWGSCKNAILIPWSWAELRFHTCDRLQGDANAARLWGCKVLKTWTTTYHLPSKLQHSPILTLTLLISQEN